MLAVADYYDRNGTANERMEAHYLLGCVYRDLGDAPRALTSYNNAVDCADTTADLTIGFACYDLSAQMCKICNFSVIA
jgi:lipopolysaccharide biosynthesis regulator YciM